MGKQLVLCAIDPQTTPKDLKYIYELVDKDNDKAVDIMLRYNNTRIINVCFYDDYDLILPDILYNVLLDGINFLDSNTVDLITNIVQPFGIYHDVVESKKLNNELINHLGKRFILLNINKPINDNKYILIKG